MNRKTLHGLKPLTCPPTNRNKRAVNLGKQWILVSHVEAADLIDR